MDDRWFPWIESTLAERGHPPGRPDLLKLQGDASTRRYYRVTARDGATYVLMVLADRKGAYVAPGQEVAEDRPTELPFLNMQRFLLGIGWPVPAVLRFSDGEGLMLLEDLGDMTLEQRVVAGDPGEVRRLYEQAVDLLVVLQVEGTRRLDRTVTAAHAAFDEATLRWEFDHYTEWGICKRQGVPRDASALAKVDAAFDRLARELAEAPRVLCHRDYHSRNLMVQAGRLRVIDFQDALLGTAAYDLGSLLRDAYVDLPVPLEDHLLARFVEGRSRAGQPCGSGESFRRLYDLQALQRNLKAAGRFDFFLHERGDDRYQRWIPGVLGKARRALVRHPDLAPLLAALEALVPELRPGPSA